jgi:hypothetical protein
LKGKNQLDPKALADFLGEKLKGALSSTTMKRYNATVIANLYENGFLAGKTGKTFSGEPLEISQEITLPVLDKCLTQNYKKIKFTTLDQPSRPVEQVTETPMAKKPSRPGAKKKLAGKPVKAKTQVKKSAKPEFKKPAEAKAEKPKKAKAVAAKAKRAPAKKPGRKPGKKAAAMVPAVIGKKPAGRKPGLVGRKSDWVKMGEGAFLYSLELSQRVEEMERMIANYERIFEAIRQLFSREMEEMEELVVGLLE